MLAGDRVREQLASARLSHEPVVSRIDPDSHRRHGRRSVVDKTEARRGPVGAAPRGFAVYNYDARMPTGRKTILIVDDEPNIVLGCATLGFEGSASSRRGRDRKAWRSHEARPRTPSSST